VGEVIKTLSDVVNNLHDFILFLAGVFGLEMSDKQLHYWIFGLAGFIIFLLVDVFFKWVARWNVSIISFIYTFTVMAVIALALEIMQKVTGSGNMEFLDFVYGVWGFVVFAGVSLVIKLGVAAYRERRRQRNRKA
jgi:hypothetical protein